MTIILYIKKNIKEKREREKKNDIIYLYFFFSLSLLNLPSPLFWENSVFIFIIFISDRDLVDVVEFGYFCLYICRHFEYDNLVILMYWLYSVYYVSWCKIDSLFLSFVWICVWVNKRKIVSIKLYNIVGFGGGLLKLVLLYIEVW